MPSAAPAPDSSGEKDPSGVWASAQRYILDYKAKPGLDPDALHGTYTSLSYVVVTTEPIGKDEHGVLVVFDDQGNLMRFVREGKEDPLASHGRPDPGPPGPASPAVPSGPPGQPGTLTATAVSLTEVDLSWEASTGTTVSGYQIERCQGPGCTSFTKIAPLDGASDTDISNTDTSYTDTGVSASTSYSYRVRATGTAGDFSPYSNTATAATPAHKWIASNNPVVYRLADESYDTKLVPRSVFPSLSLAKYTADNCPANKNTGDLYICSISDRTKMPYMQSITYKPLDDTLTWAAQTSATSGGTDELVLTRINKQKAAPDAAQTFSDVFAGTSAYAQVDFPFYGYDPRTMRIDTGAGTYFQPGTSNANAAYPSNPGETFIAQLLFKFPTLDSRNYSRFETLAHQPNLPLGRIAQAIDVGGSTEHSMTVSKVADQVDSWTLSLGLSAGIEKMLSETVNTAFSSTIEQQTKTESRYTIALTWELYWVSIIYMASLQPKEEFSGWIQQLTDDILTGKPPEWDVFISLYGTHYLHAVTQGKLEYAETRLTMALEEKTTEKTFDLKTKSTAVLKEAGVKGNSSAEIKNEWKNQTGVEVETSDVRTMSLGTNEQNGVGILYDLRPLTELLNPILFPYDSDDPWEQRAPWVWSVVRESLSAHLEDLGLNKPMLASADDDYTPRLVKVTFPSIKVSVDDRRWMGSNDGQLYAKGSITFPDADKPPQDDDQFILSAVKYQPDYTRVDGNGTAPGDTDFSCQLALRRSAKPSLKLHFELDLFPDDYRWNTHDGAFATWSGDQVIQADLTAKTYKSTMNLEVKESQDLSIYYTLHLEVSWEEIGLLGK